MNAVVDFCEKYVVIFLELISFNNDPELNLIEDDRDVFQSIIEEKEKDEVLKQELISKLNSSFDQEMIEYIKKNICEKDIEYYDSIANRLNKLLDEESNIAIELKMNLGLASNELKLEDYYNNYLIALDYLISLEIPNAEESK